MEKTIEFVDNNGNIQKYTIFAKSNIDGYEIDEDSDECVILRNIIEHMGLDFDMFEYSKTAQTYTTLKFMDHDLIRLRSDDEYNEIRLPIYNRDKYIDDDRFENQENKNQHFWISTIHNIYDYEDVIEDAMDYILSGALDVKPEHKANDFEIATASVIMDYLNISNFRVEKNNKQYASCYIDKYPIQLFDIKVGAKNKWIEIYDTKKRISLVDFNEDMIPDIAKLIEKEIKKRG